jgi:HSP20 family protein
MFYTYNKRQMDNMVNDLFSDLDTIFTSSGRIPTKHKSKNYKTDSDDSGITLTMEIPGYNKDMISIGVTGDDLVIEGKPHTGDTDGFTEKFSLGEKLDAENIEASIVDGILTLNVSYKEETKPRKIEVKVK